MPTPEDEGVTAYFLLAQKSAIKLEALGMKHSSGRSVRKHAAPQLGLKPGAKADVVIDAIEKRLVDIRERMAQEAR